MTDLALKGVHGLQGHSLAGSQDLLHGDLGDTGQLHPTPGTVAVNVQHEAGAVTRACLDGQAGELLDGLEDLAVAAHEVGEVTLVPLLGGDNGDGGAAVIDVNVNVTAEVSDIEELLEVVGTDLALLLQALHGGGAGGVLSHGQSISSQDDGVGTQRFFLFLFLRC